MTVQDTSLSAYTDLRDSLPRRERLVWEALHQCTKPPTAYELMRQMKGAGTAFDLNSTRPRLCSLYGKGCVRRIGKRKCTVTGRLAYTWQTVCGHPPAKPTKKPAASVPQEARLW
jgi:hypothetical protein